MDIRVETLGGLRVFKGEEEVRALPSKPVRASLLAYLAVERTATREQIIGLLWPERSPDKARRSLNNTVYELRSDLGPKAITTQGDTVRVAEWVRTDLAELRSWLENDADPDSSLHLGDFLEGSQLASSSPFQQWVDGRAAEAKRLQLALLRHRLESRYRAGALGQALDTASAWARRAPYDEDGHQWLIRLIAERGRRADAIAAFERFRERLQADLDMEPSPALVELVESIRAGDVGSGPAFAAEPRPPAPHSATPDQVWRPEHGWSRKLLKALGLYAAAGAGLLEVLDYLIGYWGLPESFLPAAMVLIALGFPIVAITAFLESQPVLQRDLKGIRFLLARWFSWRNAALGAIAASAAFATAVAGYRFAERIRADGSIIVVPYETATSTDLERQLADQIAGEVSHALADWDAMRVVPTIATPGPMFDLGIDGPTLRSRDEGMALAHAVDAANLAALVAHLRDDSVHISVDLVSSRHGRTIRTPLRASARADDLSTVTATIVHGLLGFDTLGIEVSTLERGTNRRAAFLADAAGQSSLAKWQLEVAEERFREAIEIDPDFGMAYLHLAQTLYWARAQSVARLETIGNELHATALLAMDRRGQLTDSDRRRVEAFYAFETGEFARARSAYQGLLKDDPTDVSSWLLLGSVEFRDPVFVIDPGRRPQPRASLNAARSAFVEAIRLQPALALSYGHLFDIQRSVEGTERGCPAFEPPDTPSRPIWRDLREPVPGSLAFCPVALDSIQWVMREHLSEIDREARIRGADGLLRDASAHLTRWSGFDVDNPTPYRYMSAIWTTRRSRLDIASPEELAELADSARVHATRAAELQGESSAVELGVLSSLHLAAGDPKTALELADSAYKRFTSGEDVDGVPIAAMNAFMATGDAGKALLLAGARNAQGFLPDPANGSLIAIGDAQDPLDRLAVMGAMGIRGEPVVAALRRIDEVWSRGSYSGHERRLLMDGSTVRVATALLQDAELMLGWDAEVSSDDLVWRALVDKTASGEITPTQIIEADLPLSRDQEIFLKASALVRIGALDQADRLYARLDSIPLRPSSLDHGWGLRVRAAHERSKIAHEQQDAERARSHAQRALAAFIRADELMVPVVQDLNALVGPPTAAPN